jgi:hypothetical protein
MSAPAQRTFNCGSPVGGPVGTRQTPAEALDYTAVIDPSNADTIASATWSINPTSATVGSPTTNSAASTVLVSGMTVGHSYALIALLTGTSGQIYSGTILINCVAYR